MLPVASARLITARQFSTPLRLVLDAAGVEGHGALGLAEPVRRLLDRLGRHAGDAPRAARVPRLHRRGHRVEAGGVRGDEVAVLQAVAQDHVQHAA